MYASSHVLPPSPPENHSRGSLFVVSEWTENYEFSYTKQQDAGWIVQWFRYLVVELEVEKSQTVWPWARYTVSGHLISVSRCV